MDDNTTANRQEAFAADFREARIEVLETSVNRETADADRVRVEASSTRLRDLAEAAIHRMAGPKVEPAAVADYLRVKAVQVLNEQHQAEVANIAMGGPGDASLNNLGRERSSDVRTALSGAADLIGRGEPLANTRGNRRQLELVQQSLVVALSRLESEAEARREPGHSAGLKAFMDGLPIPDSK